MPSAGFEPAIPATKRMQTYALDLAASGIGYASYIQFIPLDLLQFYLTTR
jgi:hypothetical protein